MSYDKAGEIFASMKPTLHKVNVNTYNFLLHLGNIRGKTALDLACGYGLYTKKLKEMGASRVIGVDVSTKMISLAKQKHPDLKFLVHDAITMPKLGEFDVVTAVHLLQYAETKEKLYSMCQNIANNLKSGGRAVLVNHNPLKPLCKNKKFGVTLTASEPLQEGDQVTLSFYNKEERVFSVPIYFWSLETYKEAFKRANLDSFQWHNTIIPEEAIQTYGEEFWEDYDEASTTIVFTARKL